jgi:hypothetical protein
MPIGFGANSRYNTLMQDDQPEKALPPEQPDSSFQYTGSQGDEQQDLQTPPEPEKIVSWSAMEYVEHNKNVGWYGLLIILILGLASGIFLITGGVFAPIIIIAIGSIFFVGAMHRPKQISYQIDSQGISIGNRFFKYILAKPTNYSRRTGTDNAKNSLLKGLTRYN